MLDQFVTFVLTDTTVIIIAAVIIPSIFVNTIFGPTVR